MYYLKPIDLVWTMYPIDRPLIKTVIYSDNQYQGDYSTRFKVNINQISFANLTSNLEIISLNKNDSLFSYQCECNVYRACSNGQIAKSNTFLSINQSISDSK